MLLEKGVYDHRQPKRLLGSQNGPPLHTTSLGTGRRAGAGHHVAHSLRPTDRVVLYGHRWLRWQSGVKFFRHALQSGPFQPPASKNTLPQDKLGRFPTLPCHRFFIESWRSMAGVLRLDKTGGWLPDSCLQGLP